MLMISVWSLNMNSIELMTNSLLMNNIESKKQISIDEYDKWKQQLVFDTLKEYRLGQSFCEYFGIGNAIPLYYFKDNIFSERWIRDNYLVK